MNSVNERYAAWSKQYEIDRKILPCTNCKGLTCTYTCWKCGKYTFSVGKGRNKVWKQGTEKGKPSS